jgi:hypothetical protein
MNLRTSFMVVAVTVSCGPTSGSMEINNHVPHDSLRNLTSASGLASGALRFAGSLGLMPIATLPEANEMKNTFGRIERFVESWKPNSVPRADLSGASGTRPGSRRLSGTSPACDMHTRARDTLTRLCVLAAPS